MAYSKNSEGIPRYYADRKYPKRMNKRESRMFQAAVDQALASAPSLSANSVSADYAILQEDGYMTILSTGANTVTMPVAADNTGRQITFVQLDNNIMTIAQNADSANIDDVNGNYTDLNTADDRSTFLSTGTEWLLMHNTITP
jgi:hypothetical protein